MLYRFSDFELDTSLYELRHQGVAQRVEPQVFDVIAYLLGNHSRLVTKDELLEAVWGDTYISDATLNSRLMAARRALGDNGRDQRLIRTLHGRGYRFVGELSAVEQASPSQKPAKTNDDILTAPASAPPASPHSVTRHASPLGRHKEVENLHGLLEAARNGARQVIFITGEAGIGKTTLVNAFVQQASEVVACMQGQCVEFTGQSEPYMPVLEALMRLCRGPLGREAVTALNRAAPTWLFQMPSLIEPDGFASLQQRVVGSNKERMLREAAEALDMLTAHHPLLLVLEDLHWSDNATLDLLALLARRLEPARLMIVGTYRPQDAAAGGRRLHSFVQELSLRGLCHELALGELPRDAVGMYMETRLQSPADPSLVQLLANRTAGNPLYMGVALDAWKAEGLLVQEDGRWFGKDQQEMNRRLPASLRLLIEQRLSSLDATEHATLQAASVAGREFAAATVAAATNQRIEEAEAICTRLARRGQFVREAEFHTWSDGTVSQGFHFVHDLYQEVLYSQIPAGQRARLHQQVGNALESAYGTDASDRLIELANHFTQGRVADKASHYLQLAAESDIRRSANREAMEHIDQAIQQLKLTPASRERDRREAGLHLRRAWAVVTTRGWSEPDAEASYQRAFDISRDLGEPHEFAESLFGLATMYEVRGEYKRALRLVESRFGLTIEAFPVNSTESFELLACSLFHQGEFTSSLENAEKGIAAHDPDYHRREAASCGDNPGVACQDWAALALLFLGYPDKALARAHQAVRLAEDPGHMYGLSMARAHASMVHQLRREVPEARDWAEATIGLSQKYGFVYRLGMGKVLFGWALSASGQAGEGLKHLLSGLELEAETGAQMDHPYFLGLLAEAYYFAGDHTRGISAVQEALQIVEAQRSFFYEAELHRLHGSLLALAGSSLEIIEAAYRSALDISRRQHGLWTELRAASSLSELLHQHGNTKEARDVLLPVYERFTEGLETPDLVAARDLLESFGRQSDGLGDER